MTWEELIAKVRESETPIEARLGRGTGQLLLLSSNGVDALYLQTPRAQVVLRESDLTSLFLRDADGVFRSPSRLAGAGE